MRERHAANESLAGWSTHQLQLNSWSLWANTKSGLGKGQAAYPVFASCRMARLSVFTQLTDKQLHKTGGAERDKTHSRK